LPFAGAASLDRSSRSHAAMRCWPRWVFTEKSVSSKCSALPSSAKDAKPVIRVASRMRYSAREYARHANAVITAVPFMIASPSLGASAIGW